MQISIAGVTKDITGNLVIINQFLREDNHFRVL